LSLLAVRLYRQIDARCAERLAADLNHGVVESDDPKTIQPVGRDPRERGRRERRAQSVRAIRNNGEANCARNPAWPHVGLERPNITADRAITVAIDWSRSAALVGRRAGIIVTGVNRWTARQQRVTQQ
jgi:hypothetical protein